MAILEKYQRDHYSTILIQTLQTGVLHFTGLPAGVVIEKRGCRFTALLAGIMYTLSFLTSCFAPTLEVLYITLGLGTGFSQGLLAVTVFAIIPHYFNTKLSMAVGFAQAGVGIGLFVFSALNGYLIAMYGLQGCFLILTGIAAHTIPLAMMMQKPHHTKEHERKQHDQVRRESKSERQCLLANDKKQSPLQLGKFRKSGPKLYFLNKIKGHAYLSGLEITGFPDVHGHPKKVTETQFLDQG